MQGIGDRLQTPGASWGVLRRFLGVGLDAGPAGECRSPRLDFPLELPAKVHRVGAVQMRTPEPDRVFHDGRVAIVPGVVEKVLFQSALVERGQFAERHLPPPREDSLSEDWVSISAVTALPACQQYQQKP